MSTKGLLLTKGKKKILKKPKYFYPVIVGIRYHEKDVKNWRYKLVEDLYVRDGLTKILERIVRRFEPYRKVSIPKMALFYVESKEKAKNLPYAAYDGKEKAIIVNMETAKQFDEEFLITHEMFHHFVSQKSNSLCNGFLYIYKNHLFGGMLDEGFTNFLTEQLCKKSENIAYVFPTFVARLIACIIGVKVANKLYISSAVTVLKEDFNKKLSKYYPTREYMIESKTKIFLELTPFETFCGTLEYIGRFWYQKDVECVKNKKRAIKCIIEMLNYYALQTETTNYERYRKEEERFFKLYKNVIS